MELSKLTMNQKIIMLVSKTYSNKNGQNQQTIISLVPTGENVSRYKVIFSRI